MVRVFVAQTHESERTAVCEFLKAAGYNPEAHETDPSKLTWLGRELFLAHEPTILVTSQRDVYGCDYISRMLHACLMLKKEPSLTVVYSRAVTARYQEIRYMAEYLLKMSSISTDLHKVKLVSKEAHGDTPAEHAEILAQMDKFLKLHAPQRT